jgi:hypothetical protein
MAFNVRLFMAIHVLGLNARILWVLAGIDFLRLIAGVGRRGIEGAPTHLIGARRLVFELAQISC